MTYQRKRVAKRLASGLLAGAVAFGGLAISGSSPAGASVIEVENDQRLGGSDRYNTSALVSFELEDRVDDAGSEVDTVIVASGENYPDALAASALAGTEVPVLLVKQNSIPTSVRDEMNRLSRTVVQVYVVGGEAAISGSVVADIENLFDDADVDRLSGDNRYATAAAIAGEVGIDAGTFAIVSGQSFADAITVSSWAATQGYPILLANGSGLPAETVAAVEEALDEDADTRFVIVGGPVAVPSSVEDALVELGAAPANVSRVAGADRYQTNLFWNLENYAAGVTNKNVNSSDAQSLSGLKVVLASGANFPDALSAAPLAANLGAHLVLVDPVSVGAAGLTLAAVGSAASTKQVSTLGAYAESVDAGAARFAGDVWVIGGTSAVPASVISTMSAAATTTMSCALITAGGSDIGQVTDNQGSDNVLLVFVGEPSSNLDNLANFGLAAAATYAAGTPLGTSGELTEITTNITEYMEINGRSAGISTVVPVDLDEDGFTDALSLGLSSDLEEGDDIEFVGIEQDASDYGTGADRFGLRNVGPCETTVARDRTAPTVDVTGVIGSKDLWFQFSEPLARNISASAWATRVETVADTIDAGANYTCTPEGGTSRQYFYCEDAGTQTHTASETLTIDDVGTTSSAVSFHDSAGNVVADDGYEMDLLTAAEAAGTEIASVTAVCQRFTADDQPREETWESYADSLNADVLNLATTDGVISIPLASSATLTLTATSGISGWTANDYSVTVKHQRGLMRPTVSVEGTAATLTVDRFVHNGADMAAALNRSALGSGYGAFAWTAVASDDEALMNSDSVDETFTNDDLNGIAPGRSCLITVTFDEPIFNLFAAANDNGSTTPSAIGDIQVRIGGNVQTLVDLDGGGQVTGDATASTDRALYLFVDNTEDSGTVKVTVATGFMDDTTVAVDSATATIS